MSHGLDRAGLLDQLQQRLDVDAGRRHQQVGQRLAVELDLRDVGAGNLDDLADQGVAVGVRAGGGQGDKRVAGLDPGAVDDLGLFHDADAEAGQVIVFAFVHAGHFGGLAADQGTARQFATGTDAGDYGGGDVDVELAGGVVVEKEQRLGAADHQVVDAHRHQVLADAVVLVQVERQAQLGAHPVGAGYQHRLLVAGRDFAEGAEAAEAAHHFRACGALGHAFDAFHQGFAGVDVHTSVLVAQRGLLAAHKSRPIGVIRRSAGRPGVQRCLPVLKARDFIRLATQRPSRLPLDGLLFKV